jgi:hypothetical protein
MPLIFNFFIDEIYRLMLEKPWISPALFQNLLREAFSA